MFFRTVRTKSEVEMWKFFYRIVIFLRLWDYFNKNSIFVNAFLDNKCYNEPANEKKKFGGVRASLLRQPTFRVRKRM